MTLPLFDTKKRWWCEGCGAEHMTVEAQPHLPLHPCPAMKGLMVPFAPWGEHVGHKMNEREDYVSGDIVDITDGRVIMNVITEHDDHTDCTIYAPCASEVMVEPRNARALIGSVAAAAEVAGEGLSAR